MSLIISIETSGKACSVALSHKGTILAKRLKVEENYPHARILHVYIDEVLQEANVKPAQLQAVAVSAGPGSYTGLRIGVAAAKGLCFALDIPLIEISTLWLIAMHAKNRNPHFEKYIPMIDARRMEVYTQSFDNNLNALNAVEPKILDETYISAFPIVKTLLCGDGSGKCHNLINDHGHFDIDENILPLAEYMCALATTKFENREFVDVKYFEPFYLKEFQSQSTFHKK